MPSKTPPSRKTVGMAVAWFSGLIISTLAVVSGLDVWYKLVGLALLAAGSGWAGRVLVDAIAPRPEVAT